MKSAHQIIVPTALSIIPTLHMRIGAFDDGIMEMNAFYFIKINAAAIDVPVSLEGSLSWCELF